MTITKKSWQKYINGLDAVQTKAKELILSYINTHDVESKEGRQKLIDYAYGISTKYGEAAAAYACLMYDAMSEAEGANFEPAEPAETASYQEVKKQVNGTIKISDIICATAIYRLVKLAGQQTTLNNAARDHIYYAWIPVGDTCAYCLAKAASDWHKAYEGVEANHIHGNCNCAYATKVKKDTTYKNYEPGEYQKRFDDAEGDTMRQKINSMRRAAYARNKNKDGLSPDWLEV